MAYSVGIDLGGTKVLAGVVESETGKPLSSALIATHDSQDSRDLSARIVGVAQEAVERAGIDARDIKGVGIGAAGQIDSRRGALAKTPNLPQQLVGVSLTDLIGSELGSSAYLFNDVVAAAAGEAAYGAGRGYSDFVCIFVGTGIGGAVFQRGEPYLGATNTAGELGHMVVDIGGRLCGCGGRGHLEAYASRTAIVRATLGALRLGRESILQSREPNPDPSNPEGSGIDQQALVEAVKDSDGLAVEMVAEAAHYMASGLVSIINFYNPPRIILGGGVVGGLQGFFDTAARQAHDEALLVPGSKTEIVREALGEDSGMIGAAVLALRQAA